jgi:stress-induced morphogen
MTPETIEERIRSAFEGCEVAVLDSTGTGDHYEVRVMAAQFVGQTPIQRHRSVLSLFSAELKSGELHALEIKTFLKSN